MMWNGDGMRSTHGAEIDKKKKKKKKNHLKFKDRNFNSLCRQTVLVPFFFFFFFYCNFKASGLELRL